MPESAPLDVGETAVGYELDTITVRDIASVRYVRHHEWLDHVLGSALPTSRIVPPKIEPRIGLEEIEKRTESVKAELEQLENEKDAGWRFHLDEDKARVLSEQISRLRTDFGGAVATEAQTEVEKALGRLIIEAPTLRSVPITYDRRELEAVSRPEEVDPSAEGDNMEVDTMFSM